MVVFVSQIPVFWAFFSFFCQKVRFLEKKWHFLKNEKEITKVLEAINTSYQFIKEAIKNNEPTGWYAKIEDESEEDTN